MLFKGYDWHGQPTIKVEGDTTQYDIQNDIAFEKIDTGDYIIKEEGTTKHILIKEKNRDTIIFYPEFFGKELK